MATAASAAGARAPQWRQTRRGFGGRFGRGQCSVSAVAVQLFLSWPEERLIRLAGEVESDHAQK